MSTRGTTFDDHLRSTELFDVGQFPQATFRSVGVDWAGDRGVVLGDLTIHGVTRRVPLEVVFEGQVRDPWGSDRAIFSATTRLNREDFGITPERGARGRRRAGRQGHRPHHRDRNGSPQPGVSQSPDSLWHRTSARLRYPSPASSATDQLTELKEPANDDQDGSPKESGARAFGHSKDLRTDLPQVVIALAGTRDGFRCAAGRSPATPQTPDHPHRQGRPDRVELRRLVWVADPYGQHGFASATNRAYLTEGDGHYIMPRRCATPTPKLRPRSPSPGRYRTVAGNLRVKEVHASGGHGNGDEGARAVRFVVCHNPEQAERDTAVRTNLIAYLEQLIDGSDDWTARRRDELVGSLRNKPGP